MTVAGLSGTTAGRLWPQTIIARLRDRLAGGEHSLARRVAGFAFIIRAASAAAVYLSQIVLARWMGGFEFGIYVTVWTWVLLAGDIIHLGLPLAAQRFIPEYTAAEATDRLRGFILGIRGIALACATALAGIGAIVIQMLEAQIDPQQVVPLYLACLTLPFFTLSIVLDGTARAYDWINLALSPHFLWRPLLILALMALAHWLGAPADATSAMICVVIATAAMALLQLVLIDRRLTRAIGRGPRHYEPTAWLRTSLPIILVWGFYTVLTYTDVLVLQHYRPPEEVAHYYAAARTLLLVSFVYFAVGAAVAHHFTALHLAGDRAGLTTLLASAVRWTFWPSLAATLVVLALGRPLLWLFGPGFSDSYPVMFVLAIGLLARASIGPAERLLNMLGEQRRCAMVYAAAFAINLTGCIVLVPRLGAAGAAIATSSAIVFETAALFLVARLTLGLHLFVFGRDKAAFNAH